VRFPRPAVMRGRDGAERWPQASDVDFDHAILRTLRVLDPSISLQWVQDVIGIHEESDVVRARNHTLQTRPSDVKAFFRSQLPSLAPKAKVAPRPMSTAIRGTPFDDPYGEGR